jgi:hypothetical protein
MKIETQKFLENKTAWRTLFVIFFFLDLIFFLILVAEPPKEYYDFGNGMKIEKQQLNNLAEVTEENSFVLCNRLLDKCINIVKR